jgi:cytochrome b6-f complex iron-sulfur subunit
LSREVHTIQSTIDLKSNDSANSTAWKTQGSEERMNARLRWKSDEWRERRMRLGRRSFLGYSLGGSLLAFVAVVLYPIWRYLIPPADNGPKPISVAAGKVGELTPSSGKIFRFGDEPGILVETPQGELRAFSAVCTHLSCTVQYRADLEHIWCACHNGHYDLNGINIAGPPPRPLTHFQVNVQGGKIFASKKP